ncbi:MAG: hypothetical protein QNK23_09275 [Crocinitomicaceae bacterium]|nr:hypothetical protein [Crocinitomicaceae bacterium]
MRKIIFIIPFLLGFQFSSFAQNDSIAYNAFYVEALGIGGLGSINYERFVFMKSKFTLGVRLGLSTHRMTDFRNKFNPDILVPISVNAMYGGKHRIEIGVGTTYSSIVYATAEFVPERETAMHGNVYLGYRFQFYTKKPFLKNAKGFLFRIGYSPIFEYFSSIRHWGGLSFGITF